MNDTRSEQLAALAHLENPYEDAPIGYLVTDPHGMISKANAAFLEWTDYRAEEVVGKKRLADFLTIGGKIFLETHFAPALHMHGHIYEIALDLVRKDGSRLPTLINAIHRRDADGHPLFDRITIFTATQRRRYEQELLLSRQEAERAAANLAQTVAGLAKANASLGRANENLALFAYAASHDLQSPLRTMSMYAQLLEQHLAVQLDERAANYLRRIIDCAHHMRGFIEDLLDLSQTEAPPIRKETDLNALLAEVLKNLHAEIESSHATITHDHLPSINLDPRQVSQLLQNLLTNPIKYRHSDRPPCIHLSSRKEQDGWLFSVQDNGIGFDANQSDAIFEPFKRLHNQAIPGTGIGLALCRSVVQAHGGRIWATSIPGQGSVFHFTIPDLEVAEPGPPDQASK